MHFYRRNYRNLRPSRSKPASDEPADLLCLFVLLNATTPNVPAKWHLIPSSGLSRLHECDRQTDKQTVVCLSVCHTRALGLHVHTSVAICKIAYAFNDAT